LSIVICSDSCIPDQVWKSVVWALAPGAGLTGKLPEPESCLSTTFPPAKAQSVKQHIVT